jgi:hypothetical protein
VGVKMLEGGNGELISMAGIWTEVLKLLLGIETSKWKKIIVF